MRARSAAIWSVLACLAVVAAALSGCGGGGDGSTATATTASQAKSPTTTTTAKEAASPKGSGSQQAEPAKSTFTPKPHHDSGGGSAQFRVKGGDNSVQEFGQESSSSELEAAATALHGFLDARAEGDWGAACSYLSAAVTKSFQQFSKQLQSGGCAAALAALSGKVPASTLAEAAQADVGSLRFEGDHAFVIYRGAQGTIYAISMEKEGGAWKVGSLGGVPLN